MDVPETNTHTLTEHQALETGGLPALRSAGGLRPGEAGSAPRIQQPVLTLSLEPSRTLGPHAYAPGVGGPARPISPVYENVTTLNISAPQSPSAPSRKSPPSPLATLAPPCFRSPGVLRCMWKACSGQGAAAPPASSGFDERTPCVSSGGPSPHQPAACGQSRLLGSRSKIVPWAWWCWGPGKMSRHPEIPHDEKNKRLDSPTADFESEQ